MRSPHFAAGWIAIAALMAAVGEPWPPAVARDLTSAGGQKRQTALVNPLFPYGESMASPGAPQPTGYRTVCVRLCDGYYWPISNSAPMSHFQRDRSICETSCSEPAKLYFAPAGHGEAYDLVGLDGAPYEALPQAYSYRMALKPQCRCKPDPWSASEVERHSRYAQGPDLRGSSGGQAISADTDVTTVITGQPETSGNAFIAMPPSLGSPGGASQSGE